MMETCWTRGCDLVRGHDGGHTLVNFAAPPTEGWGHSGPCGPNCSCDLAMALRPDAPAHEPARCGCRAICQVGEPYVVHSPRDLHERLEAAGDALIAAMALLDHADEWPEGKATDLFEKRLRALVKIMGRTP